MQTLSDSFIGAWRLVAFEQRAADGRVTYPLGPHPLGYLVYSADGYMSVQMMAAGRPRLGPEELGGGSDVEKAAALDTYRAYAGPFEAGQGRVVHHVEVSSWPGRIGVDLVRFYTFEGSRLHLRTAPFTEAGIEQVSYLTWERVAG